MSLIRIRLPYYTANLGVLSGNMYCENNLFGTDISLQQCNICPQTILKYFSLKTHFSNKIKTNLRQNSSSSIIIKIFSFSSIFQFFFIRKLNENIKLTRQPLQRYKKSISNKIYISR